MKQRFFLLRLKVKQSVQSFRLQGFGLTVIFMISLVVLSINIINVINRGRFNYDTYIYERQTLEELQEVLDERIDTYDYVISDEYKQLLLREGYAYARPNQTLYRTQDEPSIFIEEDVELLVPDLEESYSQWWLKLLF